MDLTTDRTRADDLAVVIPTVGRWDILERTLTGLATQSVQGFEVIVVSDGAGDPPPLAHHSDLARSIVQRAAGPGAARNTGVAATERSLILFLGDDMVPDPGLVAAHLAVHARHGDDRVAALGRVTWHPEVAGNPLNRWLDWSGSQFDYDNIERERTDGTERERTDGLSQDIGFGRFYSCNVSLKKVLFDSVGGFDESFVFYYEDLDLGWRLSEVGLRLYYQPEAVARHLHSYDWESIERRFRGIALGERLMTRLRPEFVPFFYQRAVESRRPNQDGTRAATGPSAAVRSKIDGAAERAVGALAIRATERIPTRLSSLEPAVRRLADRSYRSRLAGPFLYSWNRAEALCELRDYLGTDFRPELLIHYEEEVDREAESSQDEATFYRTSQAYLYDLTAFAMSPTKDPYLEALTKLAPPGARILDYGCGIGSDGLRLEAMGYEVSYADFDNPSTRYLRWRLGQRGSDSTIFDLDRDQIPGDFDAVYCFDVIEHIPQPMDFLSRLESLGRLVMVNFLEPEPGDTHLHHDLDIAGLVSHAASRRLRYYRVHHDRSHLVAYEPNRGAPAHWSVRAQSVSTLWRGRTVHRSQQALDRLGPAARRLSRRAAGQIKS